jgi:DNA helicase II / ATP-dependent DNA helicase PcrA
MFKLLEKFNEEYARLNEQQRKAVDTIDGPVMVIAGPGTGKTQILAARIGKILLDTDVEPNNILCLTYTDAGAIAMRRRLLQFIGAAAYKVNIYTYHAFCNDVIQNNLELFQKRELDPISELQRIEVLTQLIDAFPKGHPLKRYKGDVYFDVQNLAQLFSTIKREGFVIETLIEKIDKYIAGLPLDESYIYKRAYKEFKKGDVKQAQLDDEIKKQEKLKAALLEFPNYQKILAQRNLYDFDDMINWVINVFETNPVVLQRYQEQFQYVLVDEYQDTSGTQNKLVELIINYWEVPNVFVVGDDDQSIFRFQGANVENMMQFANSYAANLLTIVLKNNYRSTQPILDISKASIANNADRLVNRIEGLSKDLISSNTKFNSITLQPTITEYNTPAEEMMDIVVQVQKLIESNVKPSEIAVIYKEHKYGDDLLQYFQQKGIVVYTKRSINILQDLFVEKIITIMRYLQAELFVPYSGDELLFEILHFDFYNNEPIDIAKLTVEVNNINLKARKDEDKTSLRRLLFEKTNNQVGTLFETPIAPSLAACSKIFEALIKDAANESLQNLLDKIIRTAGVLPYLMQHVEKISLLNKVTSFFNFVKAETARNPLLTLSQLITGIIEVMYKEKIPINLVEVNGAETAVNLLTAHGSKGLEFEHVFLASVNAKTWEAKSKPNKGFVFPNTVLESTEHPTADFEELRRLFYVALTRAKTHLHISYTNFNNDSKPQEPSVFIAEIQQQFNLPVQAAGITGQEINEFKLLQFTAGLRPEIATLESDFVERLLSNFQLNVTALNNYLECPLKFFYNTLIRIPSGKNENTTFGSAVHFALDKLFKNYSVNKAFEPVENFIAHFTWFLKRNRENFSPQGFKRRLEQGEDILFRYYNQYVSSWHTVFSTEARFKGVVHKGIPLKGAIDKMEFDGNNVNVVDYKTGDIEKALKQLRPPSEQQPNGGNYWRQAVFYKILVDNYEQKKWQVTSCEFDFVEPNKKNSFSKKKVVIAPQDVETVKQQIEDTWQKIQAKEFYTGCGKEECHWCNFTKTNNLAIALHEIEDEGMEEVEEDATVIN